MQLPESMHHWDPCTTHLGDPVERRREELADGRCVLLPSRPAGPCNSCYQNSELMPPATRIPAPYLGDPVERRHEELADGRCVLLPDQDEQARHGKHAGQRVGEGDAGGEEGLLGEEVDHVQDACGTTAATQHVMLTLSTSYRMPGNAQDGGATSVSS